MVMTSVGQCDVQIENHKLSFREQAQSKCGTWDYFDHMPGGGDKKVVCISCLLPLLAGNCKFVQIVIIIL